MDKSVRLGVIGLGNIGAYYISDIVSGKVDRCAVTAVSDLDEKRFSRYPDAEGFKDSSDLITSGSVDAVVICTPHYLHTSIGIDALEHGLHVLVEKPISVHKADCERLLAAHTDSRQVFATMLVMRRMPAFAKLKKLIEDGELGRIIRFNWTVTDWFRTEKYFSSAAWRGTWEGEGGGVLINQCPHQLDLLQWLFGMPNSIRGFCAFGAGHDIEVEDAVTAYMEYDSGTTGTFITSTCESPGTNRLEIAAEMGKILLENGRLTFTRNDISTTEFSRTADSAFGAPETWDIDIPLADTAVKHCDVLQNFVDAILDGVPLFATAEEGANAVELANAILYSSIVKDTVRIPLDGAAFERELTSLIANSSHEKKVVETEVSDVSTSFHK